jgi:hypothetical protein
MHTIKAILNNDLTVLNEISAGAEIDPSQITEHDEIKYFNPSGAVITPDAGKKPSPYHEWSGSAWVVDTSKKQEVIAVLTARIEMKKEAAILNDFEFAGKKFSLSEKTKFEYKAEYDIREYLTYPHRVKCVDGYYDIQTAEEHQTWYLAGLQFIRSCTEVSWNEVDALQDKTTEELIATLNT